MALPVRIAFDVSLPVVASQAFTVGGKPFAMGDPVRWRELGVDADMLLTWWQAGMVAFQPAAVTVETPKQQRARR